MHEDELYQEKLDAIEDLYDDLERENRDLRQGLNALRSQVKDMQQLFLFLVEGRQVNVTNDNGHVTVLVSKQAS